MPITTVFTAQNLDDANPLLSAKQENDHADTVDVEISWPIPGVAPGTGVIKLFILNTIDGTLFEDGSLSVDPEEGIEVHTFMVRDETIARTMLARNIPIPPTSYKYYLTRDTDKTLSITLRELKAST